MRLDLLVAVNSKFIFHGLFPSMLKCVKILNDRLTGIIRLSMSSPTTDVRAR